MERFIIIENEDLSIPFKKETSILEVLINNDISIDHSCGGMGSCGTCRILVDSSNLPKRNEIEQERANDLGFQNFERLSCQLCPISGLEITIPVVE